MKTEMGIDNSAFDVRLRRIYVERTGRMPPPDFGYVEQRTEKKKPPLLLMALVPMLCGTGGLVGASALSGDLVPAIRLATGSAISMETALSFLEICTDALGDMGIPGFHTEEEHNAMEMAGQEMPSAEMSMSERVAN